MDYQLATNGYADLVIEIVGQMLSNKVAAILIKRLEALCHPEITPTTITALTDDQIRSIGLSHAKVGYIRNLTTAVNAGTISFDHHVAMSDQAIIQDLTQVKGIGNWSAKMYLIFRWTAPTFCPTRTWPSCKRTAGFTRLTITALGPYRKSAESGGRTAPSRRGICTGHLIMD